MAFSFPRRHLQGILIIVSFSAIIWMMSPRSGLVDQWLTEKEVHTFEDEFIMADTKNIFIANETNAWILRGKPNRWPAAPVITGDGFRALADFICEPEDDCENIDVAGWVMRNGLGRIPIIYVKSDVVGMFVDKVLDPWLHKLQLQYVLVTHNGDLAAPQPEHERLLDDPLLVAWFGQNSRVLHPKLVPIPIGVRNRYITQSHVETLIAARRESLYMTPVKALLSVFTAHTRRDVREPLQVLVKERLGEEYATTSSSGNEKDWYEDIVRHCMVLSPRGNGLDTHRTWEALYLGRVPVVKASEMDAVFEGLPVIALENWEALSKERLNEEYRNVVNRIALNNYNHRRLWLSYYARRIYETAGRVCELDNSSFNDAP